MAAPKPDAGRDAASYYEKVPTSKVGEFAHAQAQPADLNALSFSESRRTPVDGDETRTEGKPGFRTRDSSKRS